MRRNYCTRTADFISEEIYMFKYQTPESVHLYTDMGGETTAGLTRWERNGAGEAPLNSRREALLCSAVLRAAAAEKLGSSIIAEKRL